MKFRQLRLLVELELGGRRSRSGMRIEVVLQPLRYRPHTAGYIPAGTDHVSDTGTEGRRARPRVTQQPWRRASGELVMNMTR